MKKRRSFIAVALGLVFVAGLLGAFGLSNSSAAKPTSLNKPPKPFYGTVALRLKALGLDPTTRVCGTVFYSGQASGFNRVCNVLSRWVWVKRGSFVSVGLQVNSPSRCRSPQPFNLPRTTQRVDVTFTLNCRFSGKKAPAPKPAPKPKPGFSPEVILQVGCNVPGVTAFVEVRTSAGVQVITIGCNFLQKIQVPVGSAIEVCIVGLPAGATVQIVSGGVFTSPNCIRVTGGVLVITIVVVVDVCVPQPEGIQTSVPPGMIRDASGNCLVPSAPPPAAPPGPPSEPPRPPKPPKPPTTTVVKTTVVTKTTTTTTTPTTTGGPSERPTN